jgi:hypothetical protein
MPPAKAYFALAALTRRKQLAAIHREQGLDRLFKMRVFLERKMLEEIQHNSDRLSIMSEATKESFFGNSKKQGVSIRYALASCVPTNRCGGRCYAHDGRDRELQHVFRGVLNYFVGVSYEHGTSVIRGKIMALLSKAIDKAIAAAILDQKSALVLGFQRLPRIRFSHVGEMAFTPNFTNHLAAEIQSRDPTIKCVIYTRHPKAAQLNTKLLVVNFTVEGSSDKRLSYAPGGARLVNSSWDGVLNESAEINFLEHHVQDVRSGIGTGTVCPVTMHHKSTPSCDLARCEKCFVSTQ